MARSRTVAVSSSRETEEWGRAMALARGVRERVGDEVFGLVVNAADQVQELMLEGDAMGGRASVAVRVAQIVEAERRGDVGALRSAVMDLTVAGATWVAALDHRLIAHQADTSAAA